MTAISADHLARSACVYIRQSTPDQVQRNVESQRRQYALVDRARALGWHDIDVIDEDLGVSGSGTRRAGFERLLHALCEGQVGAVFSLEASRLARNGREWHTLLEFCRIVGALLIDVDTVYDPRQTNDRLLLGMKGTISEMEVASFRERAQAALRQKAQRGALVQRVPIGFIKTADDRIEKDPDARVRAAIETVFHKFVELASVRQVALWLHQQEILLPIARGPATAPEVVWLPARYHAVLSILKNPMYAGAYAYGRSRTETRLDAGQMIRRQIRRPRSEWPILIQDHHEGYIAWDVYERHQAMIAHNENARSRTVRGSIKRGGALLAGLLRCGHCGAKLLAQHPGPTVIRYQCSGHQLHPERASCVMFGGLRADRLVADQLLQCLTPLGIGAALEAMEHVHDTSADRVRQKALALEHASYEVTRARRQYDAVDPANRLVAGELERRWNDALRMQRQVQGELQALQERRQPSLTDTAKRELLALARELPALWYGPHGSPEHKKRLLRIAVKEIIATCEGETIRLIVHWHGGAHTQIEFEKIRTGRHRYITEADIVDAVRALARIEPDARIAAILNKNQRRTAHGQLWTATRVCAVRNHYAIAVHRDGERQARGEHSVGEVAAILGVGATTVLRLIRLQQLPAAQACVNAPWIVRAVDLDQFVATRHARSTPPPHHSPQLTLDMQ